MQADKAKAAGGEEAEAKAVAETEMAVDESEAEPQMLYVKNLAWKTGVRMMTVVTSCNVTPCVGIGALFLALCSKQLLCCSSCSPAWPPPAVFPFFVRWTHLLRTPCVAQTT